MNKGKCGTYYTSELGTSYLGYSLANVIIKTLEVFWTWQSKTANNIYDTLIMSNMTVDTWFLLTYLFLICQIIVVCIEFSACYTDNRYRANTMSRLTAHFIYRTKEKKYVMNNIIANLFRNEFSNNL